MQSVTVDRVDRAAPNTTARLEMGWRSGGAVSDIAGLTG